MKIGALCSRGGKRLPARGWGKQKTGKQKTETGSCLFPVFYFGVLFVFGFCFLFFASGAQRPHFTSTAPAVKPAPTDASSTV
jgi:hypothetical protein